MPLEKGILKHLDFRLNLDTFLEFRENYRNLHLTDLLYLVYDNYNQRFVFSISHLVCLIILESTG